MKKIVILIIAIILPFFVEAETVEIDGICYNLISKGGIAEVTIKDNKYEGKIIIPEKVKYNDVSYDVTAIGESAFALTRISSITIPPSIKTIKRHAFEGCSYLKEIHITNLKLWCNIDFSIGCMDLTGHGIYVNGEEIIDLVVPEGIEDLPDNVFAGCNNIKTCLLPEGLKSIGKYAFNWCINLYSINMPNSVRTINDHAFANCGFASFSFPTDLKVDGSNMQLYGCKQLKSVYFLGNITTIPASCCAQCPVLSKVVIGRNASKINYEAFAYCQELKDVFSFSNEVPSIKENEDPFYNSYVEYATLHVPAESIGQYKAHSVWGKFGSIVALTETEMGIDTPFYSEYKNKIYTLDGVKHNTAQKGLNIIQTEDGKVRKEYYK